MLIKVLSKENFIKFMNDTHSEHIAVISIRKTGDEDFEISQNLHNNIEFSIKLYFDDVEFDEPNHMTVDDAVQIHHFIDHVKDKVDKIVVHCDAGISRSAGVAGAIMVYLNGDDTDIFSNPRFRPNMYCYRLLFNELFDENYFQ